MNAIKNDAFKESKRQADGTWKHKCGTDLMGAEQRRSVHDARFSAPAGFGEVRTVKVPYCPTCHPVPPFDGPPIRE